MSRPEVLPREVGSVQAAFGERKIGVDDPGRLLIDRVRAYWNEHIHDLEITRHSVGTQEFFRELEEYRFGTLEYLPRIVDSSAYKGKVLLEIGCGVGLDLIRFAQGGAHATGVDLSEGLFSWHERTSVRTAWREFCVS